MFLPRNVTMSHFTPEFTCHIIPQNITFDVNMMLIFIKIRQQTDRYTHEGSGALINETMDVCMLSIRMVTKKNFIGP